MSCLPDPAGQDWLPWPRLRCQLLQQRLGLLEVSRVKALGEPAIDRCQQLVGLGALALMLPQASEAHGGAQLQRLRLLTTGDVESLMEALFCGRESAGGIVQAQ